MIEFTLTVTDLAETSFAVSPLQETVFSLKLWRAPGKYTIHLPWMQQMDGRRAELDWQILDACVTPRRWLPDFLTPRPSTSFFDFATELAQLRATPSRQVLADFEAAYDGRPLPAVVERKRSRPGQLLTRVIDALDEYWQACIQPWWPRMRAVLEADVLYRSRQLATSGARGLFANLDEHIRWSGGTLHVDVSPSGAIDVSGRGLVLLPSLFSTRPATMIDLDAAPVIVYPARGRATVWELPKPSSDASVARLIGPARAQLLDLLHRPATTTELAGRLGVTPSAVSQHVKVLREAGLVTGARSGRTVVYLRSPLGDALAGAG